MLDSETGQYNENCEKTYYRNGSLINRFNANGILDKFGQYDKKKIKMYTRSGYSLNRYGPDGGIDNFEGEFNDVGQHFYNKNGSYITRF